LALFHGDRGGHASPPHGERDLPRPSVTRRVLLDPRTLAAAILLAAAGCATVVATRPTVAAVVAFVPVVAFACAGTAAGYANSGST